MNFQKPKSGQAAIITVIFLLIIMLSAFSGFIGSALKEARAAEKNFRSRTAFFAAEAGVDDIVYRFKRGKKVSSSSSILLNGSTATITVNDFLGTKQINSSGEFLESFRFLRATLFGGEGIDFYYGAQIGSGGLKMNNNSKIEGASGIAGNIYSNGPIEGDNGAVITGDAVSAGSTGKLEDVVIYGNAYAHEIKSSNVCGDGYYQIIDSSSQSFLQNPTQPICPSPLSPGTLFSGSSDPSFQSMPIAVSTIESWKSDAAAGGAIYGSCGTAGVSGCSISDNGTLSLGPKMITGDLVLTKKQTLIITGTLYFKGNIDIDSTSGATIKCDSSFGTNSCILISDGWIHIRNSVAFQGSGTAGSYILVLSTKTNCNGGEETPSCTHHNAALDLHNNATGAIFYIPDSMAYLHNGVLVTQLTANKLELDNNAIVRYESGLANSNFVSGPSGGWSISEWKEVIQ